MSKLLNYNEFLPVFPLHLRTVVSMSSESSAASSRGYGPSSRPYQRLYFDGDARKFELWYVKFLGYLKLRGLEEVATTEPSSQSTTPATDGTDATATTTGSSDTEKNHEVYAELCQFIDDRSLSLIIRDAPKDGRKALSILKDHYMR